MVASDWSLAWKPKSPGWRWLCHPRSWWSNIEVDPREKSCGHASRMPPRHCWQSLMSPSHLYHETRWKPEELLLRWAIYKINQWKNLIEIPDFPTYKVFSTPPVFAWLRTFVSTFGFSIVTWYLNWFLAQNWLRIDLFCSVFDFVVLIFWLTQPRSFCLFAHGLAPLALNELINFLENDISI